MTKPIPAVYILTNKRRGTLYIGSTSNLYQRMTAHKNKLLNGFSKKYNLTKLVYVELCENKMSVFERERQLKNWKRDWKIQLIERSNPNWHDLSDEI